MMKTLTQLQSVAQLCATSFTSICETSLTIKNGIGPHPMANDPTYVNIDTTDRTELLDKIPTDNITKEIPINAKEDRSRGLRPNRSMNVDDIAVMTIFPIEMTMLATTAYVGKTLFKMSTP